ncbi:MAG: Rieske 2Fe-2S domain-containing protein [Rubrobacteraceae bacterium]
MTELQKDPITRGDFLGFGLIGTVMGAAIGIPSAAFLLSPIVKTNVLGQTDVSPGWQEVAPLSEVPEDEPKAYTVEFPIDQTYGDAEAQKQFPDAQKSEKGFVVRNAIWLSWKDGRKPEGLGDLSGNLTEEQRKTVLDNLNILSNSCAHLGCPVRWVITEGEGEFLCPCHGGIYDINGAYVAGPPPRGMYSYVTSEIRDDGKLYVKHEFDTKKGIPGISTQEPYVV